MGRFWPIRFGETPETPPSGEMGFAKSSILTASNMTRWNPDDLVGRKGYGIYSKMMRDEQLKGLIHFLRHATIARGFEFDLDEDHPDFAQHEEFAEFIGAMLDDALDGTWIDRLLDLQSSHDWGFAMLEKIIDSWEWEGKTWWALTDAKLRYAPSFYFAEDKHGNVESVEQRMGAEREDIDLARFIHYVNRPDEDESYGRSDMRECYRSWWSKDNTIKFRAIYLERMSGGFIHVQEEGKGFGTTARTAIDAMLDTMQARSAFRIPVGGKLDVKYPEDTDQFEKTIESDNKSMARAMLVPPLLGISEQGGVGSFSQARIQLEAFFFTLDARAQRLADTISEQLWKDLAFWNFGMTSIPKYVPKPMTQSMRTEIAGAWSDAIQKGSVERDMPSEQYTRKLLGYPARSEEETEEEKPVPALDTPEPPAIPPVGGTFAEEMTWVGRVDFAEVERGSDEVIAQTFAMTGAAMDSAWASMKLTIERRKLGTKQQDKAYATGDLVFPKKDKAAYRRALTQGLRSGAQFGRAQASSELPTEAMLAEFAARPPAPGMDDQLMEEFLRSRGFQSTKDISEALLKRVQSGLFNGVKFDKTTAELIADIEPLIADLIPSVDAIGRTVNKAARLETIIRTHIWEAINESRQTFFTDPALDGFVQALEYTAILDDRTTPVCQHLDGKVYPINSPWWDGRRPPNHFNCRSLTIPVTALDEWKASRPPSNSPELSPQEGFS